MPQTTPHLKNSCLPPAQRPAADYFLTYLRLFNVCHKILEMFYSSVVASTVFSSVVCWRHTPTPQSHDFKLLISAVNFVNFLFFNHFYR